MNELIDLLKSHPVTQHLDVDIQQLIVGCARNKVFQPESLILRHGESANEFYLVRHGKVALELETPGRGPVTFLTVNEGNLLGASWLVPPYRWSYDARAIDVVRVLAFDAQCLRAKCEVDPHVGYEMMKCFIPILIDRLNTARLQSANIFGQSSEWQVSHDAAT